METTTVNANQDRRGFCHSCDRPTYKKLKRVRFYAHWERIQARRLVRWGAKLPKNRLHWDKVNRCKVVWSEPQQCPINLDALWWEYENAKQGKEKIEDVRPMILSTDAIDAMIENCERWIVSIGAKR